MRSKRRLQYLIESGSHVWVIDDSADYLGADRFVSFILRLNRLIYKLRLLSESQISRLLLLRLMLLIELTDLVLKTGDIYLATQELA